MRARGPSADDARERVERALDVLVGVRRHQRHAQARRALRHRRRTDRGTEHAVLEQPLRELDGFACVADQDGNDRSGRFAGIEAERRGARRRTSRRESRTRSRRHGSAATISSAARSGGDRRRRRRRVEHVRPRAVAEQRREVAASSRRSRRPTRAPSTASRRSPARARSGRALRRRPRPGAEDAGRVRFVDDEDRVVPLA